MTDKLHKLAEALTDPNWERGHPLPSKDTTDRFSAAASPAAFLALLDERDEARAAVKRLAGALELLESNVFEDGAPDEALELALVALQDPVVKRIVEE